MTARVAQRPPRLLGLLALGVCLAVALAVGSRLPGDEDGTAGRVFYGHPAFAFDPRDDAALAGFASDIFVGRVLNVSGTEGAPTSAPGQTVPQTQFAVEVRVAIKGGAAGTVTVNQIGGYDATLGGTFLFEGDALLEPGRTSLFVTTFVAERGWYQIVAAGYGHLRAGDARQQARLVERFARAAGVPVPEEGSRGTPRAGGRDATGEAATETPAPSPTAEVVPTDAPTATVPAGVPPTATVEPTLEPAVTEAPPPTETPVPPTEVPPTETPVPPATDTPVSVPTDTPTPAPTEPPVGAAGV